VDSANEANAMTDWRSLYPFASHYFEIDSVRMHYIDEGSGLPVLMVHGNPTWSFYWRELVRALRDRYRAIAIDHIGCGLSDKPDASMYAYTLFQRVNDLVRFICQLDLQQITLVAHDWGGAIGLGAALQVSERIARIILLNTGAFPPPFVPKRILLCRTPLLGTFAVRGLNAFARAALWMATEKPERLRGAVSAGYLAPYDSWSHRVAIDRFVKDIPLSRRHLTWQELNRIEGSLPNLSSHPVQMIWGMKDWCFTPYCLERMLKSFPNAEVHRLLDAGHYVMEDAREQVVQLIGAFLARTDVQLLQHG